MNPPTSAPRAASARLLAAVLLAQSAGCYAWRPIEPTVYARPGEHWMDTVRVTQPPATRRLTDVAIVRRAPSAAGADAVHAATRSPEVEIRGWDDTGHRRVRIDARAVTRLDERRLTPTGIGVLVASSILGATTIAGFVLVRTALSSLRWGNGSIGQ